MAQRTQSDVLYKTPEKAVGPSTKNTKENEKREQIKDIASFDRTGDRASIFDDVLKTIQGKLPELAIPLINGTFGLLFIWYYSARCFGIYNAKIPRHAGQNSIATGDWEWILTSTVNEVNSNAFGTGYPMDEKIIQCQDEYHTREGKRLMDLHLQIGDKRYHLECQTSTDGQMVIRMWEYDAAIALTQVEKKGERYSIGFPHSCVLQLRGKHRFDNMEMDVFLPDRQKFTYSVPVIWLSDYTSDLIFRKHLIFLLPFYIMKYEKWIHRLETDQGYLDEMLAEYHRIEAYLEKELLDKNREMAFRDMIELIIRLADYVMRDSDKLKQEVASVMGGKILKLQTDYLIEQAPTHPERAGGSSIETIAGLFLFVKLADIPGEDADDIFGIGIHCIPVNASAEAFKERSPAIIHDNAADALYGLFDCFDIFSGCHGDWQINVMGDMLQSPGLPGSQINGKHKRAVPVASVEDTC